MIILVGNEKGGVGKSTIAINLAVNFILNQRDVLLLDTDKQGTSSHFVAQRVSKELPKINCLQKHGDIFETVKDLSSRYENIIIDAGGQDSSELRSGMLAADIIIVPIKASQIDLWAADRMNQLLKTARNFNRKVKVITVISMAPTNPNISEHADAKEMLQEYEELKLANTIIRERKIYRDSIIEGKGVLEMANAKAISEIEELYNEVING